mmetsp:Transcript_19183/g.41686  ORF Transcript_19183/g.41686 Transcript_19183/m.41686 type:complete len:90 (-) Transcript_19183:87-356(-)
MMVEAKGFFGFFFLPPPPPPPLAERVVDVRLIDGRKEKELTPFLPLSASAERRNTIAASPIILISISIASLCLSDLFLAASYDRSLDDF